MITSEGKGLIFLLSQPRGGSTVTQKIISNNPYINTTSEPWLLLPLFSYLKPELIRANYNYEVAVRAFVDFAENKANVSVKDKLKTLSLELYNTHLNNQNQYFLDKTPRYYEIAPLIQELFPQARFIILQRNPVDVLKSIVRTWKLDTIEKLYIFHRDILYAPGLLRQFTDQNQNNSQVRILKFETLFESDTSLRELFNWLNLPFDIEYFNYEGNSKADGIYGDRTFSKKENTLIKKKKYENEIDFTDEFWKPFISGYIHFLGNTFGQVYRNDVSEYVPQPSSVFSNFLDYCKFRNKKTITFKDYAAYKWGSRLQRFFTRLRLSVC